MWGFNIEIDKKDLWKTILKNSFKTDAKINDKGLNALFAQLFIDIKDYDESVFGHHWRFSIETAREFFEKEFKVIKEAPEFGPLFRKYLPFLKFKGFCTEWFMLGVKK